MLFNHDRSITIREYLDETPVLPLERAMLRALSAPYDSMAEFSSWLESGVFRHDAVDGILVDLYAREGAFAASPWSEPIAAYAREHDSRLFARLEQAPGPLGHDPSGYVQGSEGLSEFVDMIRALGESFSSLTPDSSYEKPPTEDSEKQHL